MKRTGAMVLLVFTHSRYRFGVILLVWGCFLGVAAAANAAPSVRLVTPFAPPAESIQLGIDAIEAVLLREGVNVRKYAGIAPEAVEDDLEVIVAPFDPQRFSGDLPGGMSDVVAREPGAYSILAFPRGGLLRVYAIGGDETGAMYAAFDLADQLRAAPAGALLASRIEERKAVPSVSVRGVKRSVPRQALGDALSWFHSEAYWVSFLDLLARSRFNMLEIHGALHDSGPDSTDIWLYFVSGEEASIAAEQVARNRASLRRIIELAKGRGIHVTLTTGAPNAASPARAQAPIRRLLDDFPGLDGLGLETPVGAPHVGETLERLIETVNQAPQSPLLLLEMSTADSNPARIAAEHSRSRAAVKIPINASEFGLPYVHPGEGTGEFRPVVYWDYLRRPTPFGVLFRIRTGPLAGLFPWGEVESIRELLRMTTLAGSNGFVLETDTLFPCQSADCSHYPEEYRFAEWAHERQWFLFRLWGALAYNLALSEDALRAKFVERFGIEAGAALFDALGLISRALPAIHSVRPLDARSAGLPAAMTPPPSISALAAHPPGDPFSVRSIEDEVNDLIQRSGDGRRSPYAVLQAGVQSAEAAAQALEQAGKPLDLAGRQPVGLLSAEEVALYQEWRSWLHDARVLVGLARSWRDQVNAAIQFELYRRTGDVPSLLVASESVEAAADAWRSVLEQTNRGGAVPVRTRDGVSLLHWSTMRTPFRDDKAMLARAYNEWQETAAWDGKPAHLPPPSARPAAPLLLTLSIPPSARVFSLNVSYRNSMGRTRVVDMEASRIRGVYYAEIPPGDVTEGILEYFFTGQVNEREFMLRGADGRRSYLLAVRREGEPPMVTRLTHGVSGDEMVIHAAAIDPSGVADARLLWKPLTLGGRWTQAPMRPVDSGFEGRLRLSGAGVIYAVEAADMAGNAKRFPDPSLGPPYRVIPGGGDR